jgi:prepilin signal peptidase PulO-like enzyme (type II secretory pathway)
MENKMPDFWRSVLNGGVIFGIVLIIMQLLMWMFNFIPVSFGTVMLTLLFNLVLAVVILFVFTKSYREKEMGGFISYGQAFKFGFMIYLVATVILVIYNLIFMKFIDPGYMERVMQVTSEATENAMRKRGMQEDQISRMLERMAERGKPTIVKTLVSSLISGVILGAITSAISSAFAKKEANPLK